MKLASRANSLVIFCLGLTLSFSGCGTVNTTTPDSQVTVATPTFSLVSGSFTTAVDVTLSCADSGATIYYTLDSTDPSDTHGTQYTTPLHLTATTIVKARAYKSGMSASAIALATYTKSTSSTVTANKFKVTASVAGQGEIKLSPTGGSYENGTNVQLTAVPSLGWSFGHWEGDLIGNTNPATVTVNSAKTIKAVFTQNATITILVVDPTIYSTTAPTQGKAFDVTVSCKVLDVGGTIQSAVVDLSQIGGSSTQGMTKGSSTTWTWQGTVIPPSSGLKKATFIATDTTGLTASASAHITVESANAPPSIADASVTGTLYEGQSANISVSCTATDTDGTVESVLVDLSKIGGANAQELTKGSNNQWFWPGSVTPPANSAGSQVVTFTATDNEGGTYALTITVKVGPPNTSPHFIYDPAMSGNLFQGKECEITLFCSVADTDGTVQKVTVDLSGIVGLSENAVVELTKGIDPDDEFNFDYWSWTGTIKPIVSGRQAMIFTATDNQEGVGTTTLSVDVGGANVTAPAVDVTSGFDAVTVAWELIGVDDILANKMMRIRATGKIDNTDVDYIMTPDFTPGTGSRVVDMSKLPPGTYSIRVVVFEVNDENEEVEAVSAYAPGKVIIPNLYFGEYDLSDMANATEEKSSPISGTILNGGTAANEAGYDVAGLGDIDGDGSGDFVVFAQDTYKGTGGAYVIYGKSFFNQSSVPFKIDLGNIPDWNSTRKFDATFLWYPMDCRRGDPFNAIGLPDVSGDGKGDLAIGFPYAAPLTITYKNSTDKDVKVLEDHFKQERTYPKGCGVTEPMHVPPYFTIKARQDEWTKDAAGVITGSQEKYEDIPRMFIHGEDFLPGDRLTVTSYTDKLTDTISRVRTRYEWTTGGNHGAIYLLTSQSLLAFKNNVYDLLKVGSPKEDGGPTDADRFVDTPGAISFSEGNWVCYASAQGSNGHPAEARSMMLTPEMTDTLFGSQISVMPNLYITGGKPQLMLPWPNEYVIDITDPLRSFRWLSGLVTISNAYDRYTSTANHVGCLGWAELSLRVWGTIYDAERMQSTPAWVGEESDKFSILGPTDYTQISTPAGLGVFNSLNDRSVYTNKSFFGFPYPDIIVASPTENLDAGSIYLIKGSPITARRYTQLDLKYFNQTPPASGDPNYMNQRIDGIKIMGTTSGDKIGAQVKSVGDFNGDGLSDFMYAQPDYDGGKGRVTIVFGGNYSTIDYTTADIGSALYKKIQGIVLEGENAGDHFGARICTVWDTNGDGADDILIAAPDASGIGKNECGKIYLLYGKKDIIKTDSKTKKTYVDYDGDNSTNDTTFSAQRIGQPPWTEDTPDATGLAGAVFIGEEAGDHLQAIAPVGDVNQDGAGDFILGAPYANVPHARPEDGKKDDAGRAYLIFGRKQ